MIFVVECKPDQILIETLTQARRREIIHAGNKSEVVKGLVRHYENSRGLVDEDPGSPQPRYLREHFQEMRNYEDYRIRVLKNPAKNNSLIVLRPRLEEWIIEASRESGVRIEDYNLPDDAIRLHEEINIKTDGFESLLRDLKRQSRRLRILTEILLRG